MIVQNVESRTQPGGRLRNIRRLWQCRALPAVLVLATIGVVTGCPGLVSAGETNSHPAPQAATSFAPSLTASPVLPTVTYGFNEGSGNTTADASGNANMGTLSGPSWTTAGRYGSALSFNGTNAYVEAANSNSLNPGTAATFSAWVNVLAASANISSVVNKWSQTIDDEYLFGLDSSNRLTFAWQTTGGNVWGRPSYNIVSGNAQVPLGTWTYITVVRNGPAISFYVNGNLDATFGAAADANPFRSGINTLRIGGQNSGAASRVLNGMIDEVRMYNQALTPAQIQGDMNAPIGKTALPTATYGFNEGSGNTTADASGNANMGTLSGPSWTTAGRYGSALSFNGTNAYVEAANSNSLNPGTAATFSAWVNVLAASANISSVVNKWSQTIDDEYLFGLDSSNRLTFAWQTTGGNVWGRPSYNIVSGNAQVPLGTWTYITVVRNGPAISFYVNGNLDATFGAAADANPFRSGINTLRIGGQNRGAASRVLNGMIDEVRMYNQALTPAQIQGDMNAPIGKTALPTATYGFNEGSGNTTVDASGNANVGTLSGPSWTTAGRYGYALSFNGTNAYVEAANSNSLNPGTAATFSAWVNVLAANANISSVINKWSQTSDDEYLFGLDSSNRLTFAWQTTGGNVWGRPSYNIVSGNAQVPLGTWTYITVVRNGPAISFYVNGNLDATFGAAADANPFRSGIDTVRIGGQNRGAASRVLNGVIDEVRMYSQALTPAQIQADMNAPIRKNALPEANYGFNEGNGNTTADASGNANVGTLSGPSWTTAGRYGYALSFNGTNAYVEAANSNSLNPGTAATFSAWVNVLAANANISSVINKWSQTSDDEYLFGLDSSNRLTFAWQTTGGNVWGRPSYNIVSGNVQVPLGTWTYITVVRNGPAISFYVNGNLDATFGAAADANPFRSGIDTVRIGGQNRGAASRVLNGVIDEVRMYNQALTPAQIQGDMNALIGTPIVLPSITTQPVSQSVTVGQTATFSVTATGTSPPRYQWRKNGTALSGATSASYTTPATSTSDNGAQFTVVVSNSVGSVTSNAAALSVNAASPSITTQPVSQSVTVGQTATFSVSATGTALVSYQWQKDGAAIGGSNAASYTTPATTIADNGAQFTVAVSNTAGNVTSSAASLSVNALLPTAAYAFNEGSGNITADASGNGNTGTLSGPSWTRAGHYGNAISFNGANGYVEAANSNSFNPGTAATFSAWMMVLAANADVSSVVNKWSQSIDDEYLFGLNSSNHLTFAWQTTGGNVWGQPSYNMVSGNTQVPLSTWTYITVVRNGPAISFYINGNLDTSFGAAADANPFRSGINTVRIGGQNLGSVSRVLNGTIDEVRIYNQALTQAQIQADINKPISTPTAPPSITTQPVSQTVTAGQTATFSVTVAGTAPFRYQWQKNGTAVIGANSASYTTPATSTSDNGAPFTVVVSNSAGSVTSNTATLTVNGI